MSPAAPDAAALGRLLVALPAIAAMEDPGLLAGFLEAAIREMPGVRDAKVVLGPGALAAGWLPIGSPVEPLGAVRIDAVDQALYAAHHPYLVNLLHAVASHLELVAARQALAHGLAERSAALAEAEGQLDLARTIFEHASEGILVTDTQGTILLVNPRFTQITGWAEDEVRGHTPRVLKSGLHDASFYARMWAALQSAGTWAGEIWNRRRDGGVYPQWVSIHAVHGVERRYIAVFTDLSDRTAAGSTLATLARHDPVTGLLLRDAARAELARRIAGGSKRRLALLLVDLDNFKLVNDAWGPTVGDRVLRTVGERLRDLAGDEALVVRHGGDEFLLLDGRVRDASAARHLAARVVDSFAEPILVGAETVPISASVGLALHPDHGDGFEALVTRAAGAMHAAKRLGRRTFQVAGSAAGPPPDDLRDHYRHLLHAADRGELHLHYQPQLDLRTGETLGYEALARWTSPKLGPISPGVFIPLAERTGLIWDLGAWVLRRAVRDARRINYARERCIRVAVNLSALQLRHEDLVPHVEEILDSSGVDPACIELELTESMLVGDAAHALAQVRRLKSLGLSLSIDDFGTGYSSFAYLRRLPVDRLKIDRSFVSDIDADPTARAICQAIVQVGHTLGKRVIAEGAESAGQLDALRAIGCDEVQGYVVARPAPLDSILSQPPAGEGAHDP